MNSQVPFAGGFLPPLQFRDGLEFPTGALSHRPSLPSIHADINVSATARKFSLPWLTEEGTPLNKNDTKSETVGQITSGIQISARNLPQSANSSQNAIEFSVGLRGTLKKQCSLPGQLEEGDEEEVSDFQDVNPQNTPVSTVTSASAATRESDRDSNVEVSHQKDNKWNDLWVASKRNSTISPSGSDDQYEKSSFISRVHESDDKVTLLQQETSVRSTKTGFRRNSVVVAQPRSMNSNSEFDSNKSGRRFSVPATMLRQELQLPGQMENEASAKSLVPSDAKDINVNVVKPNSLLSPSSLIAPFASNVLGRSSDVIEGESEGGGGPSSLPSQITCPHCGEQFASPPSEQKQGQSGCSGTISNLCTYVAMAGVVLIGCVAWAQNGQQMPGGELKNIFHSRHRTH